MKKQSEIDRDIELVLDGMGIVLYSDGAVKDIKEGEDYLNNEFRTPQQVAHHIQKGDIVGFSTGSGGIYTLRFREGYPSKKIDEDFPISIRLAIDVTGGKIYATDLFWLMEWSRDCPTEQQIPVDDGIYHITVATAKPETGIWGDHQIIYIFLNKVDLMPALTWSGVPELFT